MGDNSQKGRAVLATLLAEVDAEEDILPGVARVAGPSTQLQVHGTTTARRSPCTTRPKIMPED
eukprot:6455862-Amphidinium_carterae.2